MGVVHGGLWQLAASQQPAMGLVLERMPATVELTATAMLLAVMVAVPVGIVSAVRRNSFLDHARDGARAPRPVQCRSIGWASCSSSSSPCA